MKKEIRLSGKIYTIEFISGTIFYTLAIFLITPPTNPVYVKYIGIGGGMLCVQIAVLIYALVIKSEKMDERAKNNLNKSSSITLFISFLLLFIIGLVVQILSVKMTLSFGLMAFALAAILCVHALTFMTLEQLGR